MEIMKELPQILTFLMFVMTLLVIFIVIMISFKCGKATQNVNFAFGQVSLENLVSELFYYIIVTLKTAISVNLVHVLLFHCKRKI